MMSCIQLFSNACATFRLSWVSKGSLFVLVCFSILHVTHTAAGEKEGINHSKKVKSIRARLANDNVKIRKNALNELGKVIRDFVTDRSPYLKKYTKKSNCKNITPDIVPYTDLVVQILDDPHSDVKMGAYELLNGITYFLNNKEHGKNANIYLGLSKNKLFKKHLFIAIDNKKERERIRSIAIVAYYCNFPYDKEAKKGVLGEYWKNDSSKIKGALIHSILGWKLAETEEGHKILLAGIKDSDIEVRIAALQVIQETTPPKLLKPLIDGLDSQEFTLRELSYVTFAVLMYGEKAKPYQDVLIATQKELEQNRFDIENILKKLNKKDGTPLKNKKPK